MRCNLEAGRGKRPIFAAVPQCELDGGSFAGEAVSEVVMLLRRPDAGSGDEVGVVRRGEVRPLNVGIGWGRLVPRGVVTTADHEQQDAGESLISHGQNVEEKYAGRLFIG